VLQRVSKTSFKKIVTKNERRKKVEIETEEERRDCLALPPVLFPSLYLRTFFPVWRQS